MWNWHHLGAFCVHHTAMHHVTSCKAHTQGVGMFSCNLPPALFSGMTWIFYCSSTGVERIPKWEHRKLTPETNIPPPLLQGFEPVTFQSWVQCSNHWAIPALCQQNNQRTPSPKLLWAGTSLTTQQSTLSCQLHVYCLRPPYISSTPPTHTPRIVPCLCASARHLDASNAPYIQPWQGPKEVKENTHCANIAKYTCMTDVYQKQCTK